MSRTSMAVEKIKFSKIPNWSHYFLKTRAKGKKNLQNHWMWLNKPFRNALKPWKWLWRKEIGSIRVEAEWCWTAFLCLWTVASKTESKGVFTSHCDWRQSYPLAWQCSATCRKSVKTYLETLKREVLPYPPYSPEVAPSDYHLFRSTAHGLAHQHFHSYEEVKKWIDSCREKISTRKFTWQSARLSDTFKSYLKLVVPFLYN